MKRFAFGVSQAASVNVATREIQMGGEAAYLIFNYSETGAHSVEEQANNGYPEGNWTALPKCPFEKLRFDPASRQISFGRTICAKVVTMAVGESAVNTEPCRLHNVIRDMGGGAPRFETILMIVR